MYLEDVERVPTRHSLVAQTVSILRDRIANEEWGEVLPPEVDLCRHLQIGRNTLRKALAQLTAEEIIAPGRSGRRRRVLRPKRLRKKTARTETILFFSPYPEDRLPARALRQVDELLPPLLEAGYRLERITSKAFDQKRPERSLNKLCNAHRAAAWILHQTSEPMQRWFQREQVPSVILGVPHQEIQLPSVSPDIEATARHAAGLLLGKGHRRAALLTFRTGMAGSKLAEKGFRAAFDRHRPAGATPIVMETRPNVEGTCSAIAALLRARHPPTGIVMERVQMVPTLMTYCGQQGLRIPHDISVISLFDDPAMKYLVPEVTCYGINLQQSMRRVVQCVVRAAGHGFYLAKPVRMMPKLQPGVSVAPPQKGDETRPVEKRSR